jgi:nicotinamidase-related amidase
MMKNIGLLKRTETIFLIVDLQERLMPVMNEKAALVANCNKLIAGAGILTVPIIVTEQYPKGLGATCAEITLPADQVVIAKNSFSCFGSDDLQARLRVINPTSIVVAGVEAHVCVLKTVLNGLEHGYEVHVVADAISSRRQYDKEIALARMRQAGAFIATTEMILFQLMEAAGNDEFRQISKLIK